MLFVRPTPTLILNCEHVFLSVRFASVYNVNSSVYYSQHEYDASQLLVMLNDPTIPCVHLTETSFVKLDIQEFLKLKFIHHFKRTDRYAIYYGKFSYEYGGIIHEALDYPNNKAILFCIEKLKSLLPNFKFNSMLVHLYPGPKSYIPYHSDDEQAIADNSYIITLSLGACRVINFIDNFSKIKHQLQLNHGDIFIMSKNSQTKFKHGIEPIESDNITDDDKVKNFARISLTFRYINDS